MSGASWRWVVGLVVLLVGALGSADPLVARDIDRLDFDKPAGAKGEALAIPGLEIDGDARRVTRHEGPGRFARALAFSRSARLVRVIPVPAAPEVKKLDPAGWYGLVSVDVLGAGTRAGGTLHLQCGLRAAGAKDAKQIGETSLRVDWKAPGSKHKGDVPAKRLWLRVPATALAKSGHELVITVSVEGSTRIVIDDLRVDGFHAAPTRALLGKANGKNGPDRLAAGALGFVALSEHQASAFSLLSVKKKGPADKAGLEAGDLILAVEGQPLAPGSLAAGRAWFDAGHEAVLGRAIVAARAAGRQRIEVTRLGLRGPEVRTIRLQEKRALGERFPVGAGPEKALYEDTVAWVASRQKKDGFWPGQRVVNSCLAGLCLLGTRDRAHRPAIRRLVKALLELNPRAQDTKGFSFWPIAFQGIFFCEYYLATHDKRVLTWIEDAIAWLPSTSHPSKYELPAFGHSPKGLPYDNKALLAPCAHLLVFEALAERCGVKGGVWKHLEAYVRKTWSDPKSGGHGGMGYNPSHKDQQEFWSRTGLTALAFGLRGIEKRMRTAMVAMMVRRHPWKLNSHAYGEPGGALGLMALASLDAKAFQEVMDAWRWRFALAWEPGYGLHYSTAHMGAPYMGEDEIMNPAYGALFSVRHGGLVLTGGKAERWLR